MSETAQTPARERRDARRFGDRIEVAVRKARLALEEYSPRDRLVALAVALDVEEREQRLDRQVRQ